MGHEPISGELLRQLRDTMVLAFPSFSDLEEMVRFKCDRNLHAITSEYGPLEKATFNLIIHAEAHNWLDKLVRGAREYNPGHEGLRTVVEALGYNSPGGTGHTSGGRVGYKLSSPHRFDMDSQVREIADHIVGKGLTGFAVPDNSDSFLNYLRDRLHDDFGRARTYCYPATLRVGEVRLPPEVALKTITANAKGQLAAHDVIFIIAGWQNGDQATSFWQELKIRLVDVEMLRAMAIILAFNAGTPLPLELPPEVYRLPPPKFSRGDLRLWISKLVEELRWPPHIHDLWLDTVLQRVMVGDELINTWVYDHLEFAHGELQKSPSCEQWEQKLKEWGGYYA